MIDDTNKKGDDKADKGNKKDKKDDKGDKPDSVGGWLSKRAAAIQNDLKEIQENTKLATQAVQKTVASTAEKAKKTVTGAGSDVEGFEMEFTFGAGALGMDLRGKDVRSVMAGGQAERIGVKGGDSIVAIETDPLPDEDAEEIKKTIKRLMAKHPRPVTLTLFRPKQKEPRPAKVEKGNKASIKEKEAPGLSSSVFEVGDIEDEDEDDSVWASAAIDLADFDEPQKNGSDGTGDSALRADLERARVELSTAMERQRSANAKAAELRNELNTMEQSYAGLTMECQSVKQLEAISKERFLQYEIVAENSSQQLRAELASGAGGNSEIQQEVATLRSQLEITKQQAQVSVAQLEKQRDAAVDQQASSATELDRMNAEVQSFRAELQQQAAGDSQDMAELRSLFGELACCRSELEAAEQRAGSDAEASAQLRRSLKELDEQRIDISSLRAELQQCRTSSEHREKEIQAELQTNQLQVQAAELRTRTLGSEANQSLADLGRQTAELSRLKLEYQSSLDKQQDAERSLQKMQQKYDAMSEDANQEDAVRARASAAASDKARTALSAVEARAELERTELRADAVEARAELGAARAMIKQESVEASSTIAEHLAEYREIQKHLATEEAEARALATARAADLATSSQDQEKIRRAQEMNAELQAEATTEAGAAGHWRAEAEHSSRWREEAEIQTSQIQGEMGAELGAARGFASRLEAAHAAEVEEVKIVSVKSEISESEARTLQAQLNRVRDVSRASVDEELTAALQQLETTRKENLVNRTEAASSRALLDQQREMAEEDSNTLQQQFRTAQQQATFAREQLSELRTSSEKELNALRTQLKREHQKNLQLSTQVRRIKYGRPLEGDDAEDDDGEGEDATSPTKTPKTPQVPRDDPENDPPTPPGEGDTEETHLLSPTYSPQDMRERMLQLETQNDALQRRLDARPIVCQFAKRTDDDAEEDELEMANFSALPLDQKMRYSMLKFRRLPPAKRVEQLMKSFTGLLLKRPILLWLFYMHLIILYIVEACRGAATTGRVNSNYSPSTRIEDAMQKVTQPGR